MGNSNSSTRESRTSRSRSGTGTSTGNPSNSNGADPNAMYSLRSGRGSRQNLSFLHIGSSSRGDQSRTDESRRETKQERDARRREKERLNREKERDRSMREEGVDGGYLVTLGTYTGPEDFNKTVVRQLMIERRLAPFWKGLNDHKESWTENQLVAVARGLPLPAPDDPPLADLEPVAGTNLNTLTVPISSRSLSNQSEDSFNQQSSNFLRPGSASLPSGSGSRNLFRDRAKTLASLGTSTKGGSSTSIAPQELQLPRDPRVNGSPVEAVLYKDAAECPICFMYYPPYLNKTRCCDQPICSECFVQIKRPDPHPPEHHDEDGNPTTDEEGLLVSEVAACPFCVTPEFGVSYDPPPFRRGLVYPGPLSNPGATGVASPASSSTSLNQVQGRRRTTSLSASAPTVITTDRVRPDWAKKLADARAHALRRSAAATALHNAAYMLGNNQTTDSRSFASLGRRRRTLVGESSANGSETGTPRIPENTSLGSLSQLIAQIESQAAESRASGRRTRTQDLEDLMMMEAIRLSLASEEDRKKKEEKEARKEAKKREKEAAKEAKKADKAAKKGGSIYSASVNGSTTFSSMSRSTSNIPRPQTGASTASSPPPVHQPVVGKGKAPATYGFNPLSEPTSTLNTEAAEMSAHAGTAPDDAQRHLEESRAKIPQSTQPISFPEALNTRSSHLRHISNASSAASSVMESAPGSYQRSPNRQTSPNASGTVLDNGGDTPDTQNGTPSNDTNTESMFNFNTMSEMIQRDDKDRDADHVEFFEQKPEDPTRNSSNASSSKVDANGLPILKEDERELFKHGDALPVHHEGTKPGNVDSKHTEDVNVLHKAPATTN